MKTMTLPVRRVKTSEEKAVELAMLELATELEEYGEHRVTNQARGDQYGAGLHNAYESVVERMRLRAGVLV